MKQIITIVHNCDDYHNCAGIYNYYTIATAIIQLLHSCHSFTELYKNLSDCIGTINMYDN